MRLTAEQDALIRRAVEVEGTDLTNFTVTATLAHARDVLADRRLLALDDAAWLAVVEVGRDCGPDPRVRGPARLRPGLEVGPGDRGGIAAGNDPVDPGWLVPASRACQRRNNRAAAAHGQRRRAQTR